MSENKISLSELDDQVRSMIDGNQDTETSTDENTEDKESTEEQVDEATSKSESEKQEDTKETPETDKEDNKGEPEEAPSDSKEKEEDEKVTKSNDVDINQMMQFLQSVVQMNTVLNEKVSKSESQIADLKTDISQLNENVQKSLSGGDISTPQQVDPADKLDENSVSSEEEDEEGKEKDKEKEDGQETDEVETDEKTSKSDEAEQKTEAPESKSEFVAKNADGVTQPEADLEDAIGDGVDKPEDQAPAFDAHAHSKELNDIFFKKASGMSAGNQTAFRHALARLRRNQETPDDEGFFKALLEEK